MQHRPYLCGACDAQQLAELPRMNAILPSRARLTCDKRQGLRGVDAGKCQGCKQGGQLRDSAGHSHFVKSPD
jgi:hypothetical protein